MNHFSANSTISRRSIVILALACFWLSLSVAPVAAGSEPKKNSTPSTSQKDGGLSSENLQSQISDLDGQIQNLREQSLALQERTRAKLQEQLEFFKHERDTLVPRIEKLRDNSEVAWQDIKANIQKVIDDLNTSVDTIKE